MPTQIESRVREFIADNFNYRGDDARTLGASTSLLESGVIDSMGVLELVTFLESEFGIQIKDAEVTPANLDSVRAIVTYVQSKRAPVQERVQV